MAGAATVTGLATASGHAAGDSSPMAFSIAADAQQCQGCIVINAEGEIMDDTARRFAVFIAENRLKGVLPKDASLKDTFTKDAAAKDALGKDALGKDALGKDALGKDVPGKGPAAAPRVVVAFKSIGGKVVPALIMGRRIRQLGWTTVVGQGRSTGGGVVLDDAGCFSACTMVMLGGVERYLVPGSKAGLHQFSPQFSEDETFSSSDMNQIVRDYGRQVVSVYDYVKEMNVDIGFFITTMRTPFASMDLVPETRLQQIGMITGILPDAATTSIAAVLDAAKPAEPAVAAAQEQSHAALAPPLQPISDAIVPVAEGAWTVLRPTSGPASARFIDKAISVSLACMKADAAKLEVTFRALDPIALEQIRAAAFSAKRLKLAEREVKIASVAAPGRGEQGLAAMIDLRDFAALGAKEPLTLSVLTRAGKPAGRSASIAAPDTAKALSDLMADCGGI